MTNLAANLTDAVRAVPRTAPPCACHDEVLSYAELDDRTAQVAGWLRQRGLGPGDRVGIMLPNVLAFPVLYYGVLRAGGVVVPMNPLLKAREVRHYLGDSGAALVFAWHTAADEAAAGAAAACGARVTVTAGWLAEMASWPSSPEVAARADDDTAVLLYTSGTTGTPKGAQLTHANMRANASVTATSAAGPEPRRRDHGLPAHVPRLRPDLRAEHGRAGRGLHHPGPAVRRRDGAEGDRTRPRHRLRRRPDHVRRDAQRGRRYR